MEKVLIKNSKLNVSRLCMGGCPMGMHGWGEVNKSDLIKAVHCALDCGINFFDNADVYGLGESETILGEALFGRRQDAFIASKFGVSVTSEGTIYDNSSDHIKKSLEGSLKRLKTDYIDLYQIHYFDGKTPVEEVVSCLERLKQEGKIRYYGLSNIYTKDIDLIKNSGGKFVSFQDQYSLAYRDNESDIKEIQDKLSLTPMTWGSLGQGILTGKYDEDSVFKENDRRSRSTYVNFHGERLKKNLEIVKLLKEIAFAHKKTPASIAIRFILDYIGDSIVIAGAKNEKQVIDNREALGWHLEDDEIKALAEKSGGIK